MDRHNIEIPYVEIRDINTLNILGIIEGAEIFFEYSYRGVGNFEIYCQSTPNSRSLLQIDRIVTIPNQAGETEDNAWIIEKVQKTSSETGGRFITATGREAKSIIDRRIIRYMSELRSRYSLPIEIKERLFNPNLISPIDPNRKINNFVFHVDEEAEIQNIPIQIWVAEAITPVEDTVCMEIIQVNFALENGMILHYKGEEIVLEDVYDGYSGVAYCKKDGEVHTGGSRTITVDETYQILPAYAIPIRDTTQVTWDNLYDYTEALYLDYGIAAKLRIDKTLKKLVYSIYSGTDRSAKVVFSQANENILSSDYVVDYSKYKNYSLVGGEENEITKVRTVVEIPTTETGYARKEVFIDAKDLQRKYEDANGFERTMTEAVYKEALKIRGIEKIAEEHNVEKSFSGEIDKTNRRYEFNKDYYLGDLVSIRDDYENKINVVRVSKFTKVQNSDGYNEYFDHEEV